VEEYTGVSSTASLRSGRGILVRVRSMKSTVASVAEFPSEFEGRVIRVD
jgi:hypothetical protein